MGSKFKIENWDDIKDEYFEIALSVGIVEKLNLPLIYHNGCWWIKVNEDKKITALTDSEVKGK